MNTQRVRLESVLYTLIFVIAGVSHAYPQVDVDIRTGGQDAAGKTDEAGTTKRHRPEFRATTLIGAPVKNSKRDSLGTVSDIVVDGRTGNLRYYAIAHGGILGLGQSTYAVPADAVELMKLEDELYFELDADEATIKNAPTFDEANWPRLSDDAWSADVDKHYATVREARRARRRERLGIDIAAGGTQVKIGNGRVDVDVAPSPTQQPEHANTPTSFRLSELSQLSIRYADTTEAIAQVTDAMIDVVDHRVTYLAATPSNQSGFSGKLVAIPYTSLDFKRAAQSGESFLITKTAPANWNAWPAIDGDAWPSSTELKLAERTERDIRTNQ